MNADTTTKKTADFDDEMKAFIDECAKSDASDVSLYLNARRYFEEKRNERKQRKGDDQE